MLDMVIGGIAGGLLNNFIGGGKSPMDGFVDQFGAMMMSAAMPLMNQLIMDSCLDMSGGED
jgi:hypothetical protein